VLSLFIGAYISLIYSINDLRRAITYVSANPDADANSPEFRCGKTRDVANYGSDHNQSINSPPTVIDGQLEEVDESE